MIREIKFRAWDSKHNEMVFSDKEDCFYINTKGALFMYAEPKSETGLETLYHRDYNLMQYTGLKDKNGVEIYEGDILKTWHTEEDLYFDDNDLPEYDYSITVVKDFNIVEVRHEEFEIWTLNFAIDSEMHGFEVIGNIYETPELLQGDSDEHD